MTTCTVSASPCLMKRVVTFPWGVSDEGGDDHGDSDDSDDDTGVAGGVPVEQPSTSVANHTQSLPLTTSQPLPSTTTHPSPPTTTHEKPSPKPRKKPLPATEKAPPSAIVEAKEEPLPGPNINERVRAGEATLAEPEIAKAHQVVAEKLGGSQTHDPNAIQLPDESWGTVVQRENGTNIFLPVKDKPGIQSDDDF